MCDAHFDIRSRNERLASCGLSVFDSWKDPQTLSQIHMLLLDGFANGAAVSDMTIECGVVAFVSLKNPIFSGIGIHGLSVS